MAQVLAEAVKIPRKHLLTLEPGITEPQTFRWKRRTFNSWCLRPSRTPMTSDNEDDDGKQRPANDNRPPDKQVAGGGADAPDRLDAVALSIVRLIGRQIARKYFEALRAVNDNAPPTQDGPDGKGT